MFSRLKCRTLKAGPLAMLLSLLAFTIALAASGALDPAFSADGKQTTDFAGGFSEQILHLALQSDGRIVAAGERWDQAHYSQTTTHNFALARYKTDGSLDTTFSLDGKLTTDFGGVDAAQDVVIQSDGKIVTSGLKCIAGFCDLAVSRYNPNGSLDATFSGDGKVVVDFGGRDNGTYGGLAIQSDGKIVVGGWTKNGSGDYDFAVYRFKPGGALDTTFHIDGRVNFNFGSGRHDLAHDLLLQGGKIIIAGATCDSSFQHCNFAIARLGTTGSLDATFSTDGKQITDFAGSDAISGLALQPDGKILAAGSKQVATGSYFALARYKTDGTLDSTFSDDGRQLVAFGTSAGAYSVLVQGNGLIVAAGTGSSGMGNEFALVRLKPNGAPDLTFAGDGRLTINFSLDDRALDLVRQGNGRYVLGGYAFDGSQSDFALARVMP